MQSRIVIEMGDETKEKATNLSNEDVGSKQHCQQQQRMESRWRAHERETRNCAPISLSGTATTASHQPPAHAAMRHRRRPPKTMAAAAAETEICHRLLLDVCLRVQQNSDNRTVRDRTERERERLEGSGVTRASPPQLPQQRKAQQQYGASMLIGLLLE